MRVAIGGSRDPQIGVLVAQAHREMIANNLSLDDVVALEDQAATTRQRHKVVPGSRPEAGPRTYAGSRPKTPASLKRRIRLGTEGWLDPDIAEDLSQAERAIATVIAIEQSREGACRLVKGKIAAIAGVCMDMVRKTVRKLEGMGVALCRQSRRSYSSSEPNFVTFIHPAQLRWMEVHARKRKKKAGRERRLVYEAQRTAWDKAADDRKAAQERRTKAWEAHKARVAAMYDTPTSAAERRGRGQTVDASTSESIFHMESSPVASQPPRENGPSGSFFSRDGIFDAVDRVTKSFTWKPPQRSWT